MKKLIIGLVVWNLLLMVAVGSCFYTLKYHLAAIVLGANNVHEIVETVKKLGEQQKKITNILDVAMATGYISRVESVPGVPGVIQKGIICDRELTPAQIEKIRIKTMPKSMREALLIGTQTLEGDAKTHQVEYEYLTYPVIHPPERK